MKNQGFTLIELSVVLVIIAFLISGVFLGQSMIRTAGLREIIGEYDRYTKSIKEFQDKYQALPGDMSNAENIWGVDGVSGSCSTNAASTTIKIVTCNGDGNGRIGSSTSGGALSAQYEWFRAWQQLSNAGLIEGKFTGVKRSATNGDAGIGLNVPRSKFPLESGWTLYYFINSSTNATYWGDIYGHMLTFGDKTNFSGGDPTTGMTSGAALTVSDALSVDQKIDDGLPGTGTVRSTKRSSLQPNCTTNDSAQTAATYFSANTATNACSLSFILGF